MKKSPAEHPQGHTTEDIFRKGFSDAESAPPSRIWENIDRELENHDLRRYRRQAFWYRSVAAAFLLLLLSGGIFLWQQDRALEGPPQDRLATIQNRPGDVSSESHSPTPSVATRPQQAADAPAQIASVLEPISENKPQTRREASADIAASGTAFSASVEERNAPEERLALVEGITQPEEAVSTSSERLRKEKATAFIPQADKGVLEDKFQSFQGGTEKQFSRSLITALAPAQMASVTNDSLSGAPEKTILLQKETLNAALAQEQPAPKGNEAKEADVYKWSVTLAYSPQYAYAPAKIDNNAAPMQSAVAGQQYQMSQQYHQAIEEYNDSYSPAYSYTALVGASYQLNNKWQLETGLLYSQNEAMTTQSYVVYQGGYAQAYAPGNLNADMNAGKSIPLVSSAFTREAAAQPVLVNRTNQYDIRYRYQQVGVPIKIAYRLTMNKLYALFSGGVNMNLLMQSSITPDTDQVQAISYGFKDEDSPYRSVQWATTTSIGVGYDVSRKMSLLVAPEFTYSLTPLLRESAGRENMYQLGVSIGGRWRLTK